jgi:hypothetical protein
LNDKIDAIMLMLSNDRTHVDPHNVPLASLVAQEEHVDVNFIRNNNLNNNAYRNNFASNSYRPFPSNSDNGYLGRPEMPSEERFLELEKATKNFMQMQYEQNKLFSKTMEEQSALLKTTSIFARALQRVSRPESLSWSPKHILRQFFRSNSPRLDFSLPLLTM